MAKVITQETFDDTVKENIEVFSMGVEEARTETIQQFEAQGIHLGNIITNLDVNAETGVPLLCEAIDQIKEGRELLAALRVLKGQCAESVPHRILAAKHGAADVIFKLLQNEGDAEILKAALEAKISLTDKYPDIFDTKWLTLRKNLLHHESVDIICLCLKLFQKTCVLHEFNRQSIMNDEEFFEELKNLSARNENEIIREVCTLLRYLILDDDVRVEFGKAHEHARTISSEMLEDLTNLLFKFKSDKDLICDLMVTIASLCVRSEFCVVVEKVNGLKFTIEAMAEYPESIKVNKEALKLLKALAGNDAVKVKIIEQGAAPLIENCLNQFKDNENFAKICLACISTVSLRVKTNSDVLFEAGLAETICDTLKVHPNSCVIQRNGAWSIRNMVSRSREQCDTFLAHGAEDLLNEALKNHPSIGQDVRSALRDLGCKVKLSEEWTNAAKVQISQ